MRSSSMKPDEGRLQTGEHILARLLELDHRVSVGVCRFRENLGTLEVTCGKDMRNIDLNAYQDRVQEIIDKDLDVEIASVDREGARGLVNFRRIPASLKEVRVVKIGGFDKRACIDPHVNNTGQIGAFRILKVERAGKDRYRFYFSVE